MLCFLGSARAGPLRSLLRSLAGASRQRVRVGTMAMDIVALGRSEKQDDDEGSQARAILAAKADSPCLNSQLGSHSVMGAFCFPQPCLLVVIGESAPGRILR